MIIPVTCIIEELQHYIDNIPDTSKHYLVIQNEIFYFKNLIKEKKKKVVGILSFLSYEMSVIDRNKKVNFLPRLFFNVVTCHIHIKKNIL